MTEIHKKKKPSSSSSKPNKRRAKQPSAKRASVKGSASRRAPSKRERKERVVREVSAGGVVFRREARGMSFALMLDSYEKWTFPKGHVEHGESLEEAAARETLEELGLEEIRLHEYLGKIDIWFRDRFQKKGTLIHKDIHFFLFEAPKGARLHPDPDEHALDAKWVTLSKLRSKSSYSDMIPIINRALEYVRANRGS